MKNKCSQLYALAKKNSLVYLRDKSTVFFSLLSMVIIIVLTLFFLGENMQNSIVNVLAKLPNRNAAEDMENVKQFVYYWSGAGILSVNAVTVNIGSYSNLLDDQESKRINAIYTAPIARGTVAASYVLAAWFVSFIIGVVTFLAIEVIGVLLGYEWLSLLVNLQALLLILINTFAYSSILYCVALLVKSRGAWSGIATIVGTVVGFLGGIYLPVGALASGIVTVMKYTPAIYSAAMFRGVLTQEVLARMASGMPTEELQELSVYFGNTVEVFGKEISQRTQVIGFIILGIVFLGISVIILQKKKFKDR